VTDTLQPNGTTRGKIGRRPEDVVASVLANKEFMRQLEESLEEERQGIPAIPFRQILEEEAAKRRSR